MLSLQSIRQYFQRHPQKMDRYLDQNERFVFFVKEEKKEGAIGAMGCELTAKRSIAIDRRMFPLGVLAYIEYPEPEIDRQGKVVKYAEKRQFVFCQDTGGVIKGAGRADIYFGEGERAFSKAGNIKGKGRLYFLLKR